METLLEKGPRRRRRMRCPKCGSLKTILYGKRPIRPGSMNGHSIREVQKYRCNDCSGVFSLRVDKGQKYGFDFKSELVRMHVEERMSYRVMSKRLREKYALKISPIYLCRMVNEVAQMSKSSIEITREFKPVWDGYIAVDDKYIRVRGERYLCLVAVDTTGDPVHIELIEEPNQGAYDNFFRYLVDHLGYPVRAITTDLDPMLDNAVKNVFGGQILHQKCIWHGLEIIKRQIDYQKTRQDYLRFKKKCDHLSASLEDKKVYYDSIREKLQRMKSDLAVLEEEYLAKEKLLSDIREMFKKKTDSKVTEKFKVIKKQYSTKYPKVISFLTDNLDGLTTYTINQHIPKTNIMAENFNRQLQRRLKTIEAFQTFSTAFNYLNMIRNYLRFKPFTDCKGKRKYRNGSAPIELCKVKLASRDWIKNSVNLPKSPTAD
jgi:transposase-like protein